VTRPTWKSVFFLVALAFMAALLFDQGGRIRELHLSVRPGPLAVATLLLVGLFFLDALGWHLILRSLGARPSPRASIRIWLLSSLARYVPGGVWGYVSRAAFCREQGIALPTSALSLYLETLMLCAGALAAGFPAIVSAVGFPLDLRSALLLWILLGLLMHPAILALLRYLPGKVGLAFAEAKLPKVPQILALYVYYAAFWSAFGLVFLIFVRAIVPTPPSAWLPVAASMGMSFAIGFVVIFAPGGIGVREPALYLLLRPYLPEPACLLIAISSRFWIMLGEALSLALAVTLLRDPPLSSKPG